MNKCKLIIVEGIPGSGKSTTSRYLKQKLEVMGFSCRLYEEGNLDHPADFEFVACLTDKEFGCLCEKYPEKKDILNTWSARSGGDVLLSYRKLQYQPELALPESLIDELAAYDVCDGLGPDRYMELTRKRWSSFVNSVESKDEIIILECCFLQNPSVILMGKHNLEPQHIIEHILFNEETISKLDPILIYLYQEDARETICRVAKERPKEWLDFVTRYVTSQGYGKAAGLSGFDGMVAFFEARRELELQVFDKLKIDKLIVDNSIYNYDEAFNKVMQYVEGKLN